nr:hypothetical protein [Paraburkholderia sp. HD33-4]
MQSLAAGERLIEYKGDVNTWRRAAAVRSRRCSEALILSVPFTPFGKKPPFMAAELVKYTMLSTFA